MPKGSNMPTVSVKLVTGEEYQLNANENEIIYDACERQGLKLPHGCLAGSCGTCRCYILSGNENLSPPSAVEEDTLKHLTEKYAEKYGNGFLQGKTIRLSCRCKILEREVVIKPITEKF